MEGPRSLGGHALGYLEQKVWTTLLDRLGDIDRMLAALVRKLKHRGVRVPTPRSDPLSTP